MPSHIGRESVQRVVRLRGLWHSHKTIAYILGMTQGAVSKILHRHRENDDTGPRPRSGRPRITTDREDRSLVKMQLQSRFKSAPSLRSEWGTEARRPPSVRTVQRRLANVVIHGYWPARIPALTRDHHRLHRRWSHDHRNWQVEYWRHCLQISPASFCIATMVDN